MAKLRIFVVEQKNENEKLKKKKKKKKTLSLRRNEGQWWPIEQTSLVNFVWGPHKLSRYRCPFDFAQYLKWSKIDSANGENDEMNIDTYI